MKFCAKCGGSNKDEAMFCGQCGEKMEIVQQPQQQPQQPFVYNPNQFNNGFNYGSFSQTTNITKLNLGGFGIGDILSFVAAFFIFISQFLPLLTAEIYDEKESFKIADTKAWIIFIVMMVLVLVFVFLKMNDISIGVNLTVGICLLMDIIAANSLISLIFGEVSSYISYLSVDEYIKKGAAFVFLILAAILLIASAVFKFLNRKNRYN